jgi:hypothetical protein
MIIVKANKATEASADPDQAVFDAMADYHDDLAKAGVLIDASGLQASAKGWRVEWSGGRKRIVDGPFAETKELIAGFTIIKVKSREEAMDWANRFPNPHSEDCHIEIRQMFDLEDFEPNPAIERFRALGLPSSA